MTGRITARPLTAAATGARLAGTLWQPDRPAALVLMYPGSGPSDRDNDVLFPPIRDAFLEAGVAVCSFDKRGVGESTGRWEDADIADQAGDVVAALRAARSVTADLPVGLFGHSQGGWVVLRAARAAGARFVVTNSGPAVSPREQETYSTRRTLELRGWDASAVDAGVACFRSVMNLVARPFDEGRRVAAALPLVPDLKAAGVFIPDDPALWSFAARILDHDPLPDLRSLTSPLLALFGSADDVVPVERSVAALRSTVRPGRLRVDVFEGGDHRIQVGEEFVDGYLEVLTSFVRSRLRPSSQQR